MDAEGTFMSREELAELLARRAAASGLLEKLAIERAQRDGDIKRRWAEHRALRAAIYRTSRDFERVIARVEAARAENSRVDLTPAVNRHGGRARVRAAAPVPLRHPVSAQLQTPYGARARQL